MFLFNPVSIKVAGLFCENCRLHREKNVQVTIESKAGNVFSNSFRPEITETV